MSKSSVSFETLEAMKAQLRRVRDIGTPIQTDLYSHLIEVINRIMLHHQHGAYEHFEEISALVKRTNFKIKDPMLGDEVNKKASVISNKEALDFIEQVQLLLAETPNFRSAEERQYYHPNTRCVIQNFLENSEMLEWAGVSLGEDLHCLIQKSIKRLAKMSGAASLRFFGKIICSQSDYWVAQGVLPQAEEDPLNASQEPRGVGVNQTVFWVTHNIVGDWIQLPDVLPEHIQGSKMIKKMLTGNLNAHVESFPPFPGKESNLLRALLARIQHATQLCPKGLYEVDEESGEVKAAEEPPALGTEELKSLESWSHQFPIILKAGRIAHLEPEGMDEEAKEAYMANLAETDKGVDRFTTVSEDAAVEKFGAAWTSKVCGEAQQFNRVGGEGAVSYAVNVIKSVRWPGAVTVAKGGRYCNLYIGDGIKNGDNTFIPSEPPEVMVDPQEQVEQPEPNGKDPTEEPKPQAEAEEGAED